MATVFYQQLIMQPLFICVPSVWESSRSFSWFQSQWVIPSLLALAISSGYQPLTAQRGASADDYQRVKKFLESGEVQQAAQICRALNAKGDMRCLPLLAKIAEESHDYPSAIRWYTRMLEADPESKNVNQWRFSRARLFGLMNMFDWAVYDLTHSTASDPDPLHLLMLGEMQARQRDFESAEATLEKFFASTDQDYVGEVRRINVLLNMAEYEKAEYLTREYESKYAGTPELMHIDDAKQKIKKHGELIQEIRRSAAQQRRPSGLETAAESEKQRDRIQQLKGAKTAEQQNELKQLLILHAQLGMASESVQYAQVMLQILSEHRPKLVPDPSDRARIETVEGWLDIQRDQYRDALIHADKALSLDGNFGDAHRLRAQALYMLNEFRLSADAARKSLTHDRLNGLNHGYLALANIRLGLHSQAAQNLIDAQSMMPRNPWLVNIKKHLVQQLDNPKLQLMYHGEIEGNQEIVNYPERCEMLLANGLPQLAMIDIYEYMKQTGREDDPAAMSIVARGLHGYLFDTRQYETINLNLNEILAACQSAQKLNPDDPQFAMLLADLHRLEGNYELAQQQIELAIRQGASGIMPLYHLMQIRLRRGDLTGAQMVVETALKVPTENDQQSPIQTEMRTAMDQATSLTKTLQKLDFTTNTGTALLGMLPDGSDARSVLSPSRGSRLALQYSIAKRSLGKVPNVGAGAIVGLEYITTEDLRLWDHTLMAFDTQLAEIADELKPETYWFTARLKRAGGSGPSFGFFVKTSQGWRIFPSPWQ
ncbi:MAG: tetratricopeptide repeat protein [Planctomycetota bacterium]